MNKTERGYSEQIELQIKKYRSEFFSAEFRDRQSKIYNEHIQQQTVTKEDLELWNKYRNIVKEKRAKSKDNKAFFSFDDVEALGLETDLIFIYGAKNIGKTYATSQLVTKLLDKPKAQIMMLRNTRSEIKGGFRAQLKYPEWPIDIEGDNLIRKPGYLPNRGDEVTKKDVEKRLAKRNQDSIDFKADDDLQVYKPDHCGYATCITGLGLRAFQGPNYSNLKTVIWDECNDLGDVDETDILRTQIFMLSLERNNKDFKIYMLGNLLRQDSGSATNIFMDFFGIPHNAKLKYWKTDNGLKLLYINTGQAGDLYDGVKDQKFSEMYGIGVSEDLHSNQPLPYSSKVTTKIDFLVNCEPVLAYVFHEEAQFWILYIACYQHKSEGAYYVMKIERYNTSYNHPGYYPVSDNVDAVNQYGNIRYIRKVRAGKIIERIFKLNQHKRFFYADDNTRMRWTNKTSDKLRSRYSEVLKTTF